MSGVGTVHSQDVMQPRISVLGIPLGRHGLDKHQRPATIIDAEHDQAWKMIDVVVDATRVGWCSNLRHRLDLRTAVMWVTIQQHM